MTRINLVPPSELMDQHLFAEFREIKMVPMSLRRSIIARGVEDVLAKIPPAYTLNTGHVSFFYDKAKYLFKRYGVIRYELSRRGINYDGASLLDPCDVYGTIASDTRFMKDYEPTKQALAIVRARIAEKIAMKPNWYRYCGQPGGKPR